MEGRVGWITKLNVYDDGRCITGIKPTYGYDAKGAQLLGREVGRGKVRRLLLGCGLRGTGQGAPGSACPHVCVHPRSAGPLSSRVARPPPRPPRRRST